MTGSTPVLGLTLPGGGAQNKYGPADPVDIDKINDNFTRLDGAVGILDVADSQLPSNPYLNQVVHATTSDGMVKWNGSAWVNFFPSYLQANSLTARFFTQNQLASIGVLDSRYFTETELTNGGALDSVYPNRLVQGSVPMFTLPFRVAWGSYTATTTADATRGYSDKNTVVALPPNRFTGTPTIVLTPQTGATAEQHWGILSATAASFTPYYWRSDTVDPVINWIAIGA